MTDSEEANSVLNHEESMKLLDEIGERDARQREARKPACDRPVRSWIRYLRQVEVKSQAANRLRTGSVV